MSAELVEEADRSTRDLRIMNTTPNTAEMTTAVSASTEMRASVNDMANQAIVEKSAWGSGNGAFSKSG
jgi:hypothetical protein